MRFTKPILASIKLDEFGNGILRLPTSGYFRLSLNWAKEFQHTPLTPEYLEHTDK